MELSERGEKKAAYDRIYNRYIKRALDVVISGTAIILLSPLYLIISIAVITETGFPIFYRAERGGYRGETFRICKFRSMVKDADSIGGGTTAFHDPRITKVGSILRKTKLDEIPQFGQVFLGKMSLIGPRPELLQYVRRYQGREREILQVRPGITDFSSLRFINLDELVGNENADEVYERRILKEKNQLRIQYAESVSFHTDFKIMLATGLAVSRKAFEYIARGKHR